VQKHRDPAENQPDERTDQLIRQPHGSRLSRTAPRSQVRTLNDNPSYWPTPNGWKITIFLEEIATPYTVVPVNIGKGQQFTPEFLAISPNNRMPAIVDSDGPDGQLIAIFESGAILIYLADKIGRFFPIESRCRYEVLPWLMFQMSGVGPMFGQAGHFTRYAPEKIPYAIDRYTNESHRLCRVLDTRPAVEPALAVLADKRQVQGQLTDEARSILFGERQIKGR